MPCLKQQEISAWLPVESAVWTNAWLLSIWKWRQQWMKRGHSLRNIVVLQLGMDGWEAGRTGTTCMQFSQYNFHILTWMHMLEYYSYIKSCSKWIVVTKLTSLFSRAKYCLVLPPTSLTSGRRSRALVSMRSKFKRLLLLLVTSWTGCNMSHLPIISCI